MLFSVTPVTFGEGARSGEERERAERHCPPCRELYSLPCEIRPSLTFTGHNRHQIATFVSLHGFKPPPLFRAEGADSRLRSIGDRNALKELRLDQPSVCLDQPSVCFDQPSVCLDQPSACLDQPSACLQWSLPRPLLLLLRKMSSRLSPGTADWPVSVVISPGYAMFTVKMGERI